MDCGIQEIRERRQRLRAKRGLENKRQDWQNRIKLNGWRAKTRTEGLDWNNKAKRKKTAGKAFKLCKESSQIRVKQNEHRGAIGI